MSKSIIDSFRNEHGDEAQYIQLIKDILAYGTMEKGRNGITKVLVGNIMYFDLTENKLPLLTTKKVAWKSCLKELLWFIRGQTDNGILQQQNVKIWNANASRDFLESRNLAHYRDNDLGPIYGFRHLPGVNLFRFVELFERNRCNHCGDICDHCHGDLSQRRFDLFATATENNPVFH